MADMTDEEKAKAEAEAEAERLKQDAADAARAARQTRARAAKTDQPDREMDETIPGGVYIVDGRKVDAQGNEVK
jgi:hypothetical protein